MSLFSKFTKSNHNEKTLYPWSQRKISGSNNALPRFGHVAAMLDNQHFLVYGGIHNKGNPKKNLFIIDTNNISASSLSTSGDIPSLRSFATMTSIGGFVLLYGGEPLIPSEIWDPYFYVLHTNTRQWSRVRTRGQLPTERAGHSTCISNDGIMYIWGGHFQRKYLNDLCAFNVREYPSKAEWDFIPYENQGPSPRSGHVSAIYDNKLYIFGGINANHLYNDIWYFDLSKRTWHQISAVGYIPTPRESCAAAIVDDTIYIFGGKGLNGSSLGDLCAFRIKSQRWYMFQSMGPPPSPRFGHTLTVIQNKIYVFGGESVGTKNEDSSHVFILDCSKIKYPPEPGLSESEISNIDRVSNSTTATSTSINTSAKTELMRSSIETAEKSPRSNMRLRMTHRHQPSDESQSLNSPVTVNSLESNSSYPRQNSNHEHHTAVTPPPRPPREGVTLGEKYLQNALPLDPQLKFKREMPENHQLNPSCTAIDPFSDEKKHLIREILTRDGMINEIRKKEQWWRTEVSISKKRQNDYNDEELNSAFLIPFESEDDDKMLLFQELVAVKSEIKKMRNNIHKQTEPILQKIEQAEYVRTIALEESYYYKSKYIALKAKDKETLRLLESDRIQAIEKRLMDAYEQKQHIESSLQTIQDKSQQDQAARLLAEARAKEAQLQSEEAQVAHQKALEQLTEMYQKIMKTEAECRVDALTIANLSNELADRLASTEHTNHDRDISQVHIEMARLEAANIKSRNEIAVLLKDLEEGKDNEMSLKMMLNEKDQAYAETVLELEKFCIELELLKGVKPNNSNSSNHNLTIVK